MHNFRAQHRTSALHTDSDRSKATGQKLSVHTSTGKQLMNTDTVCIAYRCVAAPSLTQSMTDEHITLSALNVKLSM